MKDSFMNLNAGFSCLSKRTPAAQKGAVLLTGLIMLLVLTLVGTASMTSVTMEEKMAVNMRLSNKVFEGAETALAEAKRQLLNLDQTITITPFGQLDTDTPSWWNETKPGGFWDTPANVNEMTTATANELGLYSLPRYVIEYIGDGQAQAGLVGELKGTAAGKRRMYRITAFAIGGHAKASIEAVVQAIFICDGPCRTAEVQAAGS